MFFRKKEVVLDCYTTDPAIYKHAKITSGIKHFPEWWKELVPSGSNWQKVHKERSDFFGQKTMKNCPGFVNLYKKSFVLPLWSDLRFYIPSKPIKNYFEYSFADEYSKADYHSHEQHNNHYSDDDYQHVKIISPWFLKCDSDIEWVSMPPVWETINNLESLKFLSGTLNFRHQNGTHVSLFIKKEEEDLYIDIPCNFPLAFYLPLTERKIKVKHHLVSESELKKVLAEGVGTKKFFNRNYDNYRKLRK